MGKNRKDDANEPNRAQPKKDVRDCVVDPNFLEDLQWWAKENARICAKVLTLMEHILREPFTGIGKPEPLKGFGPDTWSRRITQEHRLVYVVFKDKVTFIQARYHY